MSEAVRIHFDLGELGGEFSLGTSEIQPWIDAEVRFWEWTATAKDVPNSDLLAFVKRQTDKCRTSILGALAPTLSDPSQVRFDELAKVIVEQHRVRNIPHSSSLRGKFLSELLAENIEAAIAAAAFFLRHPALTLRTSQHYVGFFRAAAFQFGVDADTQAALIALTDLKNEWQSELTTAKNVVSTLIDQASSAAGTIATALQNFNQNGTASIESANQSAKSFLEGWQAEFTKLQQTYDASLSLQAPVTYWSAKRRHHRKKAGILGISLAAYFVAAFLLAGWTGSILLDKEIQHISSIPVWHFAAFGTGVIVLLWIARLLVRLLLSNQHLEQDAHERITIANTFLALLRNGRVPPEQQKDLVAALLRHSPDGIVQDDAMPYSEAFALLRGRTPGG